MGGLVIKKAYMLARQDVAYETLTKRVHTIYFLATPHRGSDSAKLLNNILQIAYSSRAYVADLERGSGAIQSINDEFRKYSADIELWSFYETQKLHIGVFSTLIVDPDSATLGYREEKQMPMNADHRSICKFEKPRDPNYVILRNALTSTVNSISELVLRSKEKLRHSQLKDLENYLEVSEMLEDDLITVEDARISGTCECILWVNGKPAAGKSVLAGYAIGQLQRTNADCSYFFFKYGDKSKSRLSACLRETSELQKHFLSLGTHRFQSEKISTADTLPDIKLLIEAKAKSLSVKDDKDRAALVEKILVKSKGSFLWTVLVLNELLDSYGEEEINQVLDEVPRDMEPLYQRTLELMSRATRGKKLDRAILTWATCATRPLTTKELDGALKLDVKDSFPKLEESILALCGQLVTVDNFGKVQMVHETAREFLLNDELESEFAVNKPEVHTRITRACLIYLTGEEMKPPRTSRRGSAMIAVAKRPEFSSYACAAFSYHLAKADPLANDVLLLVDKFLKSNVLSWIEVIAQTQKLILLVRAAKNLKVYLNSCAAERSPLGREMQNIRGWTTNLIRIVMKFADALITSPSAIYSLILPFCPTESTVYNTANHGRRLSIVGLSNAQWDDRLSCIDFRQGQTSAVCHGDEFFAVGLSTGVVALYHATSCQEYKVLNHGEAVKFLQFKNKTSLMASCGMKTIRIWDTRSGEVIHNFQDPQRFIGLAFDKNLLIAASYKNYLASWDLDNNGAQRPNRPWNDSGEHINTPSRHPPCAISISVSHKMLTVAYSGRPITLWDLEEDTYYGSCGKKLPSGETSTHLVTALVFNPNPAIGLLAASYLDGELVLLDPFNDQNSESFRADCHTLAASPDRHLLAGGAGFGIIKIYEFDTLRLLYRVKSSNFYIKQLAFSRDSLHFADIRGSQYNV
ncbi:MAG: hypothetical protein Q9187_001129 [Circinaria calcarea]